MRDDAPRDRRAGRRRIRNGVNRLSCVRQNQPGLYHIAGREKMSRWEMGRLIAARWPQLQPKLVAGSLRDYHGAPRSPDTTLNCTNVQRLLSFPLPGLTKWLADHPGEIF